MPAILDTHAAIWYLLDTENLSETVFSLIDGAAAMVCQRTLIPPTESPST
jgi:PIN domain nuclease of toxin-antitoxin system